MKKNSLFFIIIIASTMFFSCKKKYYKMEFKESDFRITDTVSIENLSEYDIKNPKFGCLLFLSDNDSSILLKKNMRAIISSPKVYVAGYHHASYNGKTIENHVGMKPCYTDSSVVETKNCLRYPYPNKPNLKLVVATININLFNKMQLGGVDDIRIKRRWVKGGFLKVLYTFCE